VQDSIASTLSHFAQSKMGPEIVAVLNSAAADRRLSSAGERPGQKATFGFERSVGRNKTGQVEERGMLTLTVPW